jgi:integrase/recombinase XerD
MSRLRTVLREYLAVRRALGYKLHKAERMLEQFVLFAERVAATHVTTDLALKWATQPANSRQVWWARRLGVVRGFAEYCTSHDRRTEVPPKELLPYAYRRVTPHLYRDRDVRRLIEAARQLPSKVGLRPHTFATLFGLYAATGMRTSEPLHLDRNDVDLLNGVLTVRDAKFGKSRYIPVHPTTCKALQHYANERDRLCRHPASQRFFLMDRGTCVGAQSVRQTFIQLSRQIGLRRAGDSSGLRILDLRHRLAISTVTNWHRRGVDVERHLPELSTFLGHTHITHTQWYLTATPELLRAVLQRVEISERGGRR